MTTAQDIIRFAFDEGALLEPGTFPTARQEAHALALLNRIIPSMLGTVIGENLVDFLVPAPQRTSLVAANYPQLPFPTDTAGDIWPLPFATDPSNAIYPYPPKNSRIVFGNVTNTAFFPEAPEDGSRMMMVPGSGAGDSGAAGQILTLDGNSRTIEGSNTQTYTAPITARQWLYRADTGNWEAIVPLALTDSMPFPMELDDFWEIALAIRLAPRYRAIISEDTKARFVETGQMVKTRYRQSGVAVYGSSDFPRTLQSYLSGRWWW